MASLHYRTTLRNFWVPHCELTTEGLQNWPEFGSLTTSSADPRRPDPHIKYKITFTFFTSYQLVSFLVRKSGHSTYLVSDLVSNATEFLVNFSGPSINVHSSASSPSCDDVV